jgi:DNA-binding response OmpR family regulator
MNILICSKDPVTRQTAANALSESGFDVIQAHDGHEALGQTDWAGVGVVVLDVDWQGKGAWDLVEWLLTMEAGIPIVCLASVPGGAAWATVAEVTLGKPVQPARLLATVRRLVADPPTDRGDRRSSQQMAVRYARPYAWAAPVPVAYRNWGIND